MRMLNDEAQRKLLIELCVIQHRVVEALPRVLDAAGETEAEVFFKSSMNAISRAAELADPHEGVELLTSAYRNSKNRVMDQIYGRHAE